MSDDPIQFETPIDSGTRLTARLRVAIAEAKKFAERHGETLGPDAWMRVPLAEIEELLDLAEGRHEH